MRVNMYGSENACFVFMFDNLLARYRTQDWNFSFSLLRGFLHNFLAFTKITNTLVVIQIHIY